MDWNEVVALALLHNVTLALRRALTAPGDPVPSELVGALDHYYAAHRSRSLRQLRILNQITQSACETGTLFLATSGPALSHCLYGDPYARPAEPLTLLTDSVGLGHLQEILRRSGFEALRVRTSEAELDARAKGAEDVEQVPPQVFVRGSDRLQVCSALHSGADPNLLHVNSMLKRARRLAVGKFSFFTPSSEDLLIWLCAEWFRSRWARLSDVADVAALAAQRDGVSWQDLVRGGETAGVLRQVTRGLSLARRLYGTNMFCPVLDDLYRRYPDEKGGSLDVVKSIYRGEKPPEISAEPYERLGAGDATTDAPSHMPVTAPHWDFAYAGSVQEQWRRLCPEWTRSMESAAAKPAPFADDFITALEIAPNDNVLDLATGVGQPLLDIAARVSGSGCVLAMDLVAEMLNSARSRMPEDLADRVCYCVADMVALPVTSASVERVSCRLGIMFCHDVGSALAESLRALKPGGRAVYLVWGAAGENPALALVHRYIGASVTGIDDPSQLPLFRFGQGDELAGHMRKAGFGRVESRQLQHDASVPIEEQFWWTLAATTYGVHRDDFPSRRVAEIDDQMARALQACRKEDNYDIRLHANLVVGYKDG